MASLLAQIAIFSVIGIVVGLVVLLIVRESKKSDENTRRLARRLGLPVQVVRPWLGIIPQPLKVSGTRDGKLTEVVRFDVGHGKHREDWVAIDVTPRQRGKLTFRLSPEGFGNRLRGFFGAKEIKMGDSAFDDAWYVETNQPTFFREALVPELRQRLQELRAEGLDGRFEMHDDKVRYSERGTLSSDLQCRRFELAADMLSVLAEIVEVAAS